MLVTMAESHQASPMKIVFAAKSHTKPSSEVVQLPATSASDQSDVGPARVLAPSHTPMVRETYKDSEITSTSVQRPNVVPASQLAAHAERVASEYV